MATQTAQLAHDRAALRSEQPLVVCHCTVAHTELKSRSYHRQLLPLAETGVDVRYLAPMPPGRLASGVNVVGLGRPANLLNRVFAWPALLAKLVRQNAAIYHVQDPQLLPVAFILKLVFRKRIVYDAYEDFPSIAAGKKSIPSVLRSTAAAVVSLAEALAARSFDAVITADPLTLRRFARQRKSRKLVFYNFPNLDFFPAPRPHHASFDLVYRGGLSERTGTYVLLDALRLLAVRRNPPRLLLIGYFDDPRSEEGLRQRIHELGLGGLIEIRGRIGHERMADAIGEARIGISPLLPIRKFQLNIPVKVFEYWACGLPVIATDLAPMRPFFRNGEAGLLVTPASATLLAESIARLLDHPDDAACMGRRGRALVSQRFNNVTEVQKLGKLFRAIVNKPNRGRLSP